MLGMWVLAGILAELEKQQVSRTVPGRKTLREAERISCVWVVLAGILAELEKQQVSRTVPGRKTLREAERISCVCGGTGRDTCGTGIR